MAAEFAPETVGPAYRRVVRAESDTQKRILYTVPCRSRRGGKDKTVAGLLAIFLGGWGIQYFYLGKTTAGILTIVISLCSCYIWGLLMLIQGILMLTMSDEAFNEKYVDNDKTFPLF